MDLMPALFQLLCLTWNTPRCRKRILNPWPQSLYISRPAGCPLCVCSTPACLQCGYCVHHKGILSLRSWSYQSLAELPGVGKVVLTTGGSIHTQSCLLSPHRHLKTMWTLSVCVFSFDVNRELDAALQAGNCLFPWKSLSGALSPNDLVLPGSSAFIRPTQEKHIWLLSFDVMATISSVIWLR